jgi:hypothetical protein
MNYEHMSGFLQFHLSRKIKWQGEADVPQMRMVKRERLEL